VDTLGPRVHPKNRLVAHFRKSPHSDWLKNILTQQRYYSQVFYVPVQQLSAAVNACKLVALILLARQVFMRGGRSFDFD